MLLRQLLQNTLSDLFHAPVAEKVQSWRLWEFEDSSALSQRPRARGFGAEEKNRCLRD